MTNYGAPSLRRLAAACILSHAHEYDEASQSMLTSELAFIPGPICGALRDPTAFAGASALPELLDVLRATLAERSRSAQLVLNDLIDSLRVWRPTNSHVTWREVEISANHLLAVGRRKSEVIGCQLPKSLADKLRHVRKLAQGAGSDRRTALDRAFRPEPSLRAIDLDAMRRAYKLRELDAHTG